MTMVVRASQIAKSVGNQEFEFALAKQLRSEYFNMEIQLFNSLLSISTALTKLSKPKRKEHLCAHLRVLDFQYAKGFAHFSFCFLISLPSSLMLLFFLLPV
jgi:hypothetical protein